MISGGAKIIRVFAVPDPEIGHEEESGLVDFFRIQMTKLCMQLKTYSRVGELAPPNFKLIP